MYQSVNTVEVIRGLQLRNIVSPDLTIAHSHFRNTRADEITIVRARGKSTKEFVRVPLQSVPIQGLHGTAIIPQLLLWNSHLGESTFQAKLGFFRLVCSNGMALGSIFDTVKLRHVVGPKFETEFSGFFERLEMSLEGGFRNLEELTARRLTLEEVDAVLPKIAQGRVAEEIRRRFLAPVRIQDGSQDVWSLWNVANEVLATRSRSPVAFEQRNETLLTTIIGSLAA
jgi:hypothetical protein